MLDVHENEFARVEVDREGHLAKLIRKPVPMALDRLERVMEDFQLFVPLRERPRLVLLQDMRLAPLSRDEATERALLQITPRLFAKFATRGLLLATPVGRLQASRFIAQAQETTGEQRVFLEESEALRWARHEAAKLAASVPVKAR
jgi:hypothetical protein